MAHLSGRVCQPTFWKGTFLNWRGAASKLRYKSNNTLCGKPLVALSLPPLKKKKREKPGEMNQSGEVAGKQTQLWRVSSFVKLFRDEMRLFNDMRDGNCTPRRPWFSFIVKKVSTIWRKMFCFWGNLLRSVLIKKACLPKLILIILLGEQRNKLSALLIAVLKTLSQTVLERKLSAAFTP